MPVDNTRVVSSRRTQKKLTEEELQDIDRKRLKGELSCAECRRLKLRCDKKLPCGSCYRRGCESICPLGILAAGQGTRFILADTEQLHEKIYEMSNRIRQLEDALAILQADVSDQRHPLLTDDLLKIKFGSEALNARGELPLSKDEDAATTKSIDALGTLTLGSSGDVQYFGRSAGSETLMMKADEENADSSSDEDNEPQPAPTETVDTVENLADAFPFSSKARPNADGLQAIELLLPPRERAAHLCQSYIDHASYFFRPIGPDDLRGDLFPTIYDRIAAHKQAHSSDPDSDKSSSVDSTSPHSLAILCFIFALGALLDMSQPPFNSEAERYYDLGRAALSLRPVYDSPNIDSVSALGLMATYNSLAGKRYTRDSAWCIMSFAAKLAQTIGLHRDSARWNMDNKTVQKRRNLFWEIFSSDLSHSLALGRPPSNHPSYVDCEFPIDEDASLSSDATETQAGFWRTKHRFARDIYNSVADATLIARTPSYDTILDLDRKVREISFPASFNPYVTREAGADIFHSSSLALRDFYASQNRTVTMLYLHRSFFAQAMLDHPSNPLLSPFAPSFLTAYRSASIIIKASAHLFERCAAVAMRLWFLMNHTFSAAVILGTVMTRSPTSNVASMAMRDFNLAVSLFERNAAQSQRAKIALGVLLKLKEKAARSYQQQTAGQSPTESTSTSSGSPPFGLSDDLEDDLAIFGGQMRVLDRKASGKHHHRSMLSGGSAGAPGGGATATPSSTSSSTEVSPAAIPATIDAGTGATSASGIGLGLGLGSLGLPEVHPSLVAYLNQDAVRKVVERVETVPAPAHPAEAVLVPPAPGPSTVSVSGQAHEGAAYPAAFTPGSHWLNGTSQYLTGGRTSDEVEERGFGHISLPAPHAGPSTSTQGQHLFFGGPTRHWSSAINFDGLMQEFGPSTGLPMFEPSISNNSTTAPMHDTSFPSFHPPSDAPMFDIQHAMNHDPLANLPPGMAALFGAGPSNPAAFSGFGYPDISMGYQGMNGSSNVPQPGGFYPHDFGVSPTISMDQAGAIDLGLSSESGMDASWMSFMRDCGIMDTDG